MLLNRSLTFDDVLLVPGYSNIESRKDVDVSVSLGGELRFNIPIVSANMDTITGFSMARSIAALGGLPILHRSMPIDINIVYLKSLLDDGLICGVSVGVDDFDRASGLYDVGARIFCLDVAHAHSKLVGKCLERMRDSFEDIFIIAGNVATYAGADYLVSKGADAVKVGLGAGSVCTTREKTGFGVPQFTAIMDCARINAPIIADGGIRTPGDAVKALAAGATMVMLGGMLAGTDEAPGGTRYRGMASTEAQEENYGSVAEWRTDEGIAIDVDRKGPVEGVIKDVIGGIRSGLSYAGARNIKELQRKAQFIEVTKAVVEENKPHGESSRYRRGNRALQAPGKP